MILGSNRYNGVKKPTPNEQKDQCNHELEKDEISFKLKREYILNIIRINQNKWKIILI